MNFKKKNMNVNWEKGIDFTERAIFNISGEILDGIMIGSFKFEETAKKKNKIKNKNKKYKIK